MRPRLALALLAGAALVVVAVAANGASPVPYEARDAADDAPPPAPQATSTPVDTSVDGSAVGGSLVVVLIVLGVMALIVFLGLFTTLRLPKRRRRGAGMAVDAADAEHQAAPAALVLGARRALAGIEARTAGPPRDAVVSAWLTLEEAAADSGAARAPHETPTEFTGALLARHRVDATATAELRSVYQRARFGVADVTDDDARTARDALRRIVHDLAPVRGAR
ncbi:DUF4129 domain-containing protein [Saccharothrix australiensis]|uniref:Uncharacterized protein DUF4129 n=1 Tax=Saccharothrix australiensis TaxID=2072 RepID=A0A495VT67_9PSEU|nr:DUF4129 domain-containing protein [Saccharothrix australiensis]RKT52532.1 uncharacterized protein DUF4129 [Saccharothrix australiensis]